ncbi:hypothetical protein J7E93_08005 [Streptomyces sp. ISL-36]|uniref:hypothetical protein n=1 Tax=Streptomyces sp. ISL-36 TaxID=2819182 RepID=UPI001BEB8926|nr:hypothetical protein [Streptomyces sp. ISL-36]
MLIASTLLLLAVLAGYTLLCAVSPFGTCRTCRGLGHKVVLDRKGRPKRAKPCRRCKGHGKRLRLGRRLHNHSRDIHRAGTR